MAVVTCIACLMLACSLCCANGRLCGGGPGLGMILLFWPSVPTAGVLLHCVDSQCTIQHINDQEQQRPCCSPQALPRPSWRASACCSLQAISAPCWARSCGSINWLVDGEGVGHVASKRRLQRMKLLVPLSDVQCNGAQQSCLAQMRLHAG
ncbi:hypothetical protein COO60DRAFT_273213 [Scenedesmus sp. NREL 46B-D3]|nr:hypothetical protein COO60DRAFT_273213 [Scenedesmus sp. NREL 46B-D3]